MVFLSHDATGDMVTDGTTSGPSQSLAGPQGKVQGLRTYMIGY